MNVWFYIKLMVFLLLLYNNYFQKNLNKLSEYLLKMEKILLRNTPFLSMTDIERWFYAREKRTDDFVPKIRNINGVRKTYFSKAPNRRTFRKRNTPRIEGEKSHIRNYRPEIPKYDNTHNLGAGSALDMILEDSQNGTKMNRVFFYRDGNLYLNITEGEVKGTYLLKGDYLKNPIDLVYHIKGKCPTNPSDVIQVDSYTLKPIVDSALQIIIDYELSQIADPKYSRKFSDELPQTMPKIPYKEIRALRTQSTKLRKASYMLVNCRPPIDVKSLNNSIPVKKCGKRYYHTGNWTYHAPKGRMGHVNPRYPL